MTLHAQFQTAVSLIYPSRCVSCGERVAGEDGLCPQCWGATEFLAGALCACCGVPLVGEAAPGALCDSCLRAPPEWDRGRAALAYQGAGRRMVLGLKHGDRTDLVRPAARWMARAGGDLLDGDPLLVPVPLHWGRFLRRRYNQAALLAWEIGAQRGLSVCPDLLRRSKRTPRLDGRPEAERHALLREAITVNKRRARALQGRINKGPIVLVDDVLTSGATLGACARALRELGAQELRILVLLRTTRAVTGW